MRQKKHPRLRPIPSSFLTPIAWTHPDSCNTTVWRCFHHRWGDPKEGSWRREPCHLETWSPGGFQSSSSPEAPRPLGAVGVVSLQEDPPGSGGCGPVQRGTGLPGPWGRAHWLAHPPNLPQPQDSPSKGPKASGMWQQTRSLRPEGKRVSILFL